MFKKKGDNLWKSMKQSRNILKNDDKKTKIKMNKVLANLPSYVTTGDQFPVVKGTFGSKRRNGMMMFVHRCR